MWGTAVTLRTSLLHGIFGNQPRKLLPKKGKEKELLKLLTLANIFFFTYIYEHVSRKSTSTPNLFKCHYNFANL